MRVAIIPARGGSKRIPKKNIRNFLGKPMIAYAIAAAERSGLFDRIIVSTDSEEIAEIAQASGAEIPFRRPDSLATDHATTSEVLLHAVQWLMSHGECDEFCCIYPASPLVTPEAIRCGHEAMEKEGADGAMSVCSFEVPVQRSMRMEEGGRMAFNLPVYGSERTQDLKPVFFDAAQFYWCRARAFLEAKDLMALRPVAVVLPATQVQDIDNPVDWEIAELKFLRLQHRTRVHDVPRSSSIIVQGTAQLGFSYGIANRGGKPSAATANCMLCAAWSGGIRIYETAQAYGDSEYVLGDFFAGSFGFSDARFITKLHPDVDVNDADDIRRHIEESLRRLKIQKIWLLMLHNERHIDQWSGGLGKTLVGLQRDGLIGSLGASVYDEDFARKAIRNPDLTYVSIPGGVFDRRMKRAGIQEIAAAYNKKLFLRSVFLQGLALMEESQIPLTIPHGREATAQLRKFCSERGLDSREFAFDYVRSAFPEALIVLGAETTCQVQQNCRLACLPQIDPEFFDQWDHRWPKDFEGLYNPSLWP